MSESHSASNPLPTHLGITRDGWQHELTQNRVSVETEDRNVRNIVLTYDGSGGGSLAQPTQVAAPHEEPANVVGPGANAVGATLSPIPATADTSCCTAPGASECCGARRDHSAAPAEIAVRHPLLSSLGKDPTAASAP